MSDDQIIPYAIGAILVFIVAIFITRAIFSIPKFLKLQKAQLQMLTEIAIRQGVKPEVIRTIHVFNDLELREKSNEETRAELEKAKKDKMTDLEKEALSYPKE